MPGICYETTVRRVVGRNVFGVFCVWTIWSNELYKMVLVCLVLAIVVEYMFVYNLNM